MPLRERLDFILRALARAPVKRQVVTSKPASGAITFVLTHLLCSCRPSGGVVAYRISDGRLAELLPQLTPKLPAEGRPTLTDGPSRDT